VPFDHAITDGAELRGLYRPAHPNVRAKSIDHLDDEARRFIALSPFVVVSTAGGSRVDASPRGGPPGFVTVLDDKRLALGDLAGNNRLDSLGNIVERPAVGLLFLVPGRGETLRVNGQATITTDPAVLDTCRVDGRLPKVAVGVDVEECFVHCAKAFRRSGMWEPASWPDLAAVPTAGTMFKAHLGLDGIDAELIDADLEAGYQATMWEVGGCDVEPSDADVAPTAPDAR
jgi:PPOX class probable FMN-dependent enzyme